MVGEKFRCVFHTCCYSYWYTRYRFVLGPVLSHPILSFPILSSPILFYPILLYPYVIPILSCPILSCPILSSDRILSYRILLIALPYILHWRGLSPARDDSNSDGAVCWMPLLPVSVTRRSLDVVRHGGHSAVCLLPAHREHARGELTRRLTRCFFVLFLLLLAHFVRQIYSLRLPCDQYKPMLFTLLYTRCMLIYL